MLERLKNRWIPLIVVAVVIGVVVGAVGGRVVVPESGTAQIATFAPSWAKRMDVALPVPNPGPLEPAPVTIATFPSSLSLCGGSCISPPCFL